MEKKLIGAVVQLRGGGGQDMTVLTEADERGNVLCAYFEGPSWREVRVPPNALVQVLPPPREEKAALASVPAAEQEG